jgi:hypothetical protein
MDQAMYDKWPLELSRKAAELFAGAAGSRTEMLRRLTEIAGWHVPGCCGASATFWHRGRMTTLAATPPSMAPLAERQVAGGDGPIIAALRTGDPVAVTDTAREDRWPQFAMRARAAGVRSSLTIARGYHSMILTMTLYRPCRIARNEQPVLQARLLAALESAAMAGATGQTQARRTATGPDETITGRAGRQSGLRCSS